MERRGATARPGDARRRPSTLHPPRGLAPPWIQPTTEIRTRGARVCRECARAEPSPDRQPRRSRGPDHPRVPGARDRDRRRLLDRRPGVAARPPRRPRRPRRAAASRRELPQDPLARRGGHHDRLRRRAPRLGLPRRERRLRARLRGERPRLRGPAARDDRDDGGQDRGARGRRGGGPAARPRVGRRGDARAGARARDGDRLPAPPQGFSGRRRARACDSWTRRRGSRRPTRPRRPRRRRPSRTARSTSRGPSSTRATSRSRCSATARAACSRSGERDCSIQRRHQKLIEEGPVAGPDARPARRDGGRRPRACEALALPGRRHDRVPRRPGAPVLLHRDEHAPPGRAPRHGAPDRASTSRGRSFAVAAGDGLPRTGRAELVGHAIEVRINAEDPSRGFLPAPGTVTRFSPPLGPGVRVDTHVTDGYRIPPYYDSLVAKVIVWAEDRPAAIARLRGALTELELEGVPTTRDLALDIVCERAVRGGDYTTGFLTEAAAPASGPRGGVTSRREAPADRRLPPLPVGSDRAAARVALRGRGGCVRTRARRGRARGSAEELDERITGSLRRLARRPPRRARAERPAGRARRARPGRAADRRSCSTRPSGSRSATRPRTPAAS